MSAFGVSAMEEKKVRAQDRWDEKAGMVPKTYKVKKDDAEAFAAACKAQGVAVGVTLSRLMRQYAEQNQ